MFKILVVSLFMLVPLRAEQTFTDLTIIVNSCDKYEELWKPFFDIFFKQWKGINVPIILISNKKTFTYPNVINFQNPNETTWSDTIEKALKTVKTTYVLYLQDDYFMTRIDIGRLFSLFQIMKDHKLGYLQLAIPTGVTELRKPLLKEQDVFFKNKHEKYRTSLQAAFWNRDVFLHLLDSRENIWDFEITGSLRSEGCMMPFATITTQPPVDYLNMAAEGRLNTSDLEKIKDMYNISWATSLPLSSDFSWKVFFKKNIERPLYWDVWLPLKTIIKSWL